jgi:2-phospho-L-lactate guanylyltransferase
LSLLGVIPVKSLPSSKSRLQPLLSAEQRQHLTLSLLNRTIHIMRSACVLGEILLVSRDEQVQTLAQEEGLSFLMEKANSLNPAVEEATRWALDRGFTGMLILPLDLPWLRDGDVSALAAPFPVEQPSVVIAPDRRRQGTNGLFLSPPGILPYSFGPGSFARHVNGARHSGARLFIYCSSGTERDLDWPEDYERLCGKGVSGSGGVR